MRQTTFVDTTRPTPPFGWYPGSPWRTLPTTIWYPSDGGGPYPLVVFAHGYSVTPATYANLLPGSPPRGTSSPRRPTRCSAGNRPGRPTQVDWDELFTDTWFVTTRVLELSRRVTRRSAG